MQKVDIVAIVGIRLLLIDLPSHELSLAGNFAELLTAVVALQVSSSPFATVQRLHYLRLRA